MRNFSPVAWRAYAAITAGSNASNSEIVREYVLTKGSSLFRVGKSVNP